MGGVAGAVPAGAFGGAATLKSPPSARRVKTAVTASPFAALLPGSRTAGNTSSLAPKPLGLATFGITPSKKKDKTNTGILQFALIPGPEPCMLVKFAPHGCWSEKIMMDSMKKKEHWLAVLDPYWNTFIYMVDNMEVKNARGYGIRLFGFKCGIVPEDEALVAIGNHICSTLNAVPGNSVKVEIDKARLFFTSTRLTTWSYVTGDVFALRHLQEQAGESVNPGFYAEHTDLLHAHFASGALHPDFAMIVGAPRDQIDPVLLAEVEKRQQELEGGLAPGFNLPEAEDDGNNNIRVEDVDDDADEEH